MAEDTQQSRRSKDSNVARLPDKSRRPVEEPTPSDTEASLGRPPSIGVRGAPSVRRVLLVLGPLLFAVAGLYVYLSGGRYVSTDNAYLRADKLNIATDVPGFVAEVAVRDDQKVEKGQLLLRLEDEPFRIALAGTQAQLGMVRNEIESLQATYRQNLAQVEQARVDLAYFDTEFARQKGLITKQATTQTTFEQSRRDLQTARERVAVLQREAEATLAQLGGRADDPVENNPRYRHALSEVDKAMRDLRHTVVKASMAGIVTNVDHVQLGSYLPAAQPAFDLVATDHVWVEANPKETDLTYMKVGDSAEIVVDAYPSRKWSSVVDSISPASGAEFSVLPPQNASGNWVKVVQRVPVRLRLDLPPDAPPLRAGLSAEISIDTGHRRTLADLVSLVGHWLGV